MGMRLLFGTVDGQKWQWQPGTYIHPQNMPLPELTLTERFSRLKYASDQGTKLVQAKNFTVDRFGWHVEDYVFTVDLDHVVWFYELPDDENL